jgi:hypothetical protein
MYFTSLPQLCTQILNTRPVFLLKTLLFDLGLME